MKTKKPEAATKEGDGWVGHQLHAYFMEVPNEDVVCVLFRFIPTYGEQAKCFPAYRMSFLGEEHPDWCAQYGLNQEDTYYLTENGIRTRNAGGGWTPLLPVRLQTTSTGQPTIDDVRGLGNVIVEKLFDDPAFRIRPNMRVAPTKTFVLSTTKKWVDLIGTFDASRYLEKKCGEPQRGQEEEYYQQHKDMIWSYFHRGQTDETTNKHFGIPANEEDIDADEAEATGNKQGKNDNEEEDNDDAEFSMVN